MKAIALGCSNDPDAAVSFGSGEQEYVDALDKITSGKIKSEKYTTIVELSSFRDAVATAETGEALNCYSPSVGRLVLN